MKAQSGYVEDTIRLYKRKCTTAGYLKTHPGYEFRPRCPRCGEKVRWRTDGATSPHMCLYDEMGVRVSREGELLTDPKWYLKPVRIKKRKKAPPIDA